MNVCIVYGTETGSTEIASFSTYFYLKRSGIPVEIHLSSSISPNSLSLYDFVLFFLPTCAFGDFPHNFKPLFSSLSHILNNGLYLQGLKYTIFGLGDSRYPLYNYAARRLQGLLNALKASEFFPSAFGDEQHHLGFDGELIVWREDLLSFFSKLTPPTALQHFIFPFKLSTTSSSDVQVTEHKFAEVVCNKIISSENHFTNVRSVVIEGEGVDYETGDVALIFPTDEEGVDDVLALLNLDPEDQITLDFNPDYNIQSVLSIHYSSSVFNNDNGLVLRNAVCSRRIELGRKLSMRELFGRFLCLKNLCTPFQMYIMSMYTEDKLHKDKLLEMAGDVIEGCLEYYRYCKSEKRSFYDVLYDFPSVKLPLEVLINISNPYYSRLYSIASSEVDFTPDPFTLFSIQPLISLGYHQFRKFMEYEYRRSRRIELCVADVRYHTKCNRVVNGINSNYLNKLQLGDSVEYCIYRPEFSNLLLNTDVPILFICTGTGITTSVPFIQYRSYLFKELWRRNRTLPSLRDLAFIGFRRPNRDQLLTNYHLYQHWCKFVFVYSRIKDTKFYVQHAIKEHSQEVYKMLINGIVLIGGKSHPMPSDVLESLEFVLAKEAGFGSEAAKKFVQDSIEEYKIIIDTWG